MLGYKLKGSTVIHDGDWVNANYDVSSAITTVGKMLESTKMRACVSLIVATKVNYYQTNHHTGRSTTETSGYTAKTINKLLADSNLSNEEQVTLAHTLGHWASTKAVLRACMGDRELEHPLDTIGMGKIIPTSDALIRLVGVPAGWAKTGIAYAIATRMINSIMASLFS
ncbi:hypothetical protein PHET_11157 [Paragonimus heterotremus]|uniref:Uncharacterized protein n=1 Tax=Paragonimus heterotremus TaxID=100268 RepID=A0A8J4WCI0_9TREM|nr:hypothetical protein PHET_11157 [Paragonimus heterotremus]